ncbi:MAG: hypothetical protein USCAAHI_00916 [Beijerinckiaceae bacterium]|nr:MAG: hypothetical protein USCAAHI_00916 [Beijerinckiaceae bacterium]
MFPLHNNNYNASLSQNTCRRKEGATGIVGSRPGLFDLPALQKTCQLRNFTVGLFVAIVGLTYYASPALQPPIFRIS